MPPLMFGALILFMLVCAYALLQRPVILHSANFDRAGQRGEPFDQLGYPLGRRNANPTGSGVEPGHAAARRHCSIVRRAPRNTRKNGQVMLLVRLPENALLAALAALIKGAREQRLASFQPCQDCGHRTAPEDLHDTGICQACADRDTVIH